MEISTCFTLLLLSPFVSSLVLPMLKPNGDPDMMSVINHVTVMEQTIASLQAHAQTTDAELAEVKAELKTTQSHLISSQEEVIAVKAEMRLAETKIESLKTRFDTLNMQINFTVIDAISAGVKLNTMEIGSVKSDLQTTATEVLHNTHELNTTLEHLGNIRSQVSDMNITLTHEFETAKSRLQNLEAEYKSMETRQNITEQELAATNGLIQSITADLKIAQNQVPANVTDIQMEWSLNRDKYENIWNNILARQNITEEELEETKALVQSTAAECNATKQQQAFLNQELHTTESRLQDLEAECKSMETKENITEEKFEATNGFIQSITADLRSVQHQVFADVKAIQMEWALNRDKYENTWNTILARQNITKEEVVETKALVQSTAAECNATQQRIDFLNHEFETTESRLQDLEAECTSMETRQNITEEELGATKVLIQSTTADLSQVSADVKDLQMELALDIDMYEKIWNTILASQNITEQELEATKVLMQSTTADLSQVAADVKDLQMEMTLDIDMYETIWDKILARQNNTEQELEVTKALVQSTAAGCNATKQQQAFLTREFNTTESRVLDLEAECKSMETRQNITEEELEAIKVLIQSTKTDFADIKMELALDRDKYENIWNTTLARQNITEEELEKTKALVQSTAAGCNATEQQLTVFTHKFDTTESRLQDLETECKSMETRQNITEEELEALQSTTADLKLAQSQVSADIKMKLALDRDKYENIWNTTLARQNITEEELEKTKALVQSTAAECNATKHQLALTGTPGVRFQVSLDKHSNTGFKTLKFDSVNFNVGGGYNKHSGIFTAPVSGTYSLWANIIFYSPVGEKSISIQLGEKVLASGATFVEQAYDFYFGLASATTVTHLNAGDKIHFTTDHPDNKIVTSNRSSYGGVLLHAS